MGILFISLMGRMLKIQISSSNKLLQNICILKYCVIYSNYSNYKTINTTMLKLQSTIKAIIRCPQMCLLLLFVFI